MSVTDNTVLPVTVIRGLNDRVYDKRKMAALEVERIVRDLMSKNETKQVKKVIEMLVNSFALSQNSNARKGGLIGLAAAAIALGKDIGLFLSELVPPVLKSFSDVDGRVRYFACESMYNIAKVARGSMLLFYKETFDGISKLVCDPDTHVKNGAELLDRLIKDIVTESNHFDVDLFVTLVRDRIYSNNEYVRQYLVSWIQLLCSVPDIDLVPYFPHLLDGLFKILSDPNQEIRTMTQQVLNDFLIEIGKKGADFKSMIVVLLANSKSTHVATQLTALVWIQRFLELDGKELTLYCAGILNAVLPCLANENTKSDNLDTAVRTKDKLLFLLTESTETLENMYIVDMMNVLVAHIVPGTVYADSTGREYTSPNSISDTTKMAVLQWILMLHSHIPAKINEHHDKVIPAVIKTLSDSNDEVVLFSIKLLSALCIQNTEEDQANFENFLKSLVGLFKSDEKLLEKRCSFIIQTLCQHIDSENVFCTLSGILSKEEDIIFTALIVQYLNWILLTSPNLSSLRKTLKKSPETTKASTKDSKKSSAKGVSKVFTVLYNTWCHDAVSTIALCMLSGYYQHASDVIYAISQFEITEMTLSGLDKLVQLIESPVFSFLRLELVQPNCNSALIRSLAGILMLLPQSDVFHLLRNRLECAGVVRTAERLDSSSDNSSDNEHKKMLELFNKIQIKHSKELVKLNNDSLVTQ